MIYATTNSFFTVWRGDIKEKYSEFTLSTSRKDRRDGSYKNSNWSFVRFAGDAFEKSKRLKERDRITNVTFSLELEPYMNQQGEKVYPKSPRFVIFDFEMASNDGSGGGSAPARSKPRSKPYADTGTSDEEVFPDIDDDDSDELPF